MNKKTPRNEFQPLWALRVLTAVSIVGFGLSFVSEVAAVLAPRPARPYASALAYLSIAMLSASWVFQRLSRATPPKLRSPKHRAGLLVGLHWMAWSLLYVVLIAPAHDASHFGPQFNRPFALWVVGARMYESIWLGWLSATSAILFMTAAAGRNRATQSVVLGAADSDAPRPLAVLSKWGLIGVFGPPAFVALMCRIALALGLLSPAALDVVYSVAIFWLLLGALVVAIALVIRGIGSNPSTRQRRS
jgi:hypothetical protein